MGWTPPKTWFAGERDVAAVRNVQFRDNFLALSTSPYSYAHVAADVNLVNATWTDVTTWTIDESAEITYSAGVWTIPSTGRYMFSATGSFAMNATGVRGLRPVVNGVVGQNIIVPGNGSFQATATLLNEKTIAATQTVKFQVYQNAGASPAAALRGDAGGIYTTAIVRRVGA